MKKCLNRIIILIALMSLLVCVLTYIKKYLKFNENLEDDFYDFEEGEDDDEPLREEKQKERKYIALKNSTQELVHNAKETAKVAKTMVSPAKDIIDEVSNIVVDKVKDVANNIKSEKVQKAEALKEED